MSHGEAEKREWLGASGGWVPVGHDVGLGWGSRQPPSQKGQDGTAGRCRAKRVLRTGGNMLDQHLRKTVILDLNQTVAPWPQSTTSSLCDPA